MKQECIPVGCILPAHWPYLRVCSAPGGAYLLPRGVPAWSWGVSAWSRGCLPGPRGGACLVPGGLWYPNMHWGTPHPLWTESQTPVKILPCPNFVAGGKNWTEKGARILGTPCSWIRQWVWYMSVFPTLCICRSLSKIQSLPPATKLGQGNIFISVCQEFCPWRGRGRVWYPSMPCRFSGQHPGGSLRGLAREVYPSMHWGRHPPADDYCRGRYASYRNAFLFPTTIVASMGQNAVISLYISLCTTIVVRYLWFKRTRKWSLEQIWRFAEIRVFYALTWCRRENPRLYHKRRCVILHVWRYGSCG